MNLTETMSKMLGRKLTTSEARQLADEQFGMLATYLREQWEKDKAVIVWTQDDIAVLTDDELTEDQAIEILKNLERNHDADSGISWDTLRNEIEDAGFSTHEPEFE